MPRNLFPEPFLVDASKEMNCVARTDFAAATCRMSKLRVPAVAAWRWLSRAACRNAEGHRIDTLAKRPFLRSFCRFAHAAVTSACEIRPRNTPNSNAFLTSRACNAVHPSGTLIPER